MNNLPPWVSGQEWRERFSHKATYGIMTKKGWRLTNGTIQIYHDHSVVIKDMTRDDQLISFPLSVYPAGIV